MTQAPVNSVDTLAAIIREVDRGHGLSAHALARAILDHPGSRWGAAAPSINFRHLLSPEPGFERVPDDGDPERLPRDAQQVGGKWWGPRFGSDSLATTLGAILERMVGAAQPAAPWLEPPAEKKEPSLEDIDRLCEEHSFHYDDDASLECLRKMINYAIAHWGAETPPTIPAPVSLLAAPWPELRKDLPVSGDWCDWWTRGYEKGWGAARDELQRQWEQARAVPTAAPAVPEISDCLIKSLIGDVLAVIGTATEQSCLGRCWNPVGKVRARLMEVLQLAAQEAQKPAP